MIKLKVQKLDPASKLPSYAYDGDAGMDLFSLEETQIPAGEKIAIRTGLKFAIPRGYAGFVWDKSGLAAKHHLKTMAGVLDSNYRGEFFVVLTNLGKEIYKVEKGSKIAQLVIKPVANPEIEEGEIQDETDRGEGGFGSSGDGVLGAGHGAREVAPTSHIPHPTSLNYRPSWDEYFMMAAKLIAVMATCPKLRVGTVVVKNKRIVASGFNGAPPGNPHCTEVGCLKFEEEGTSCRRVIHSEHNAILQDSANLVGGTLYTAFLPCIDCMKAIIAARITEVVYEKEYESYKNRYKASRDFAAQSGIKLRQISEVDIVDVLARYYGKSFENRPSEVLEF